MNVRENVGVSVGVNVQGSTRVNVGVNVRRAVGSQGRAHISPVACATVVRGSCQR